MVRARGGADAAEPIATLLADLLPDGSWTCDAGLWEEFSGPGWRLLASVQWGADPTDPRLQAACERLLDGAPGSGGFAWDSDGDSSAWLTARVLQALARLGWCRHSRFQEALAWLDEAAPHAADGGWSREGRGACAVTPVVLLDALTVCGGSNRAALRERAIRAAASTISVLGEEFFLLGHPNFGRTDAAEAFAVLARSGAKWDPVMLPALERLQHLQLDSGQWARASEVQESLPVGLLPRIGRPSKWITLAAASAVLYYAVEAGLPRRFPRKPA